MLHTDIIIADIQIAFWTNHSADIDTLNEMFLYHIGNERFFHKSEQCHDVIISSSSRRWNLPEKISLAWCGNINENMPIKWFNDVGAPENFITIGNDILIRHIPQRKLTICYLTETKAKFCKLYRPNITNYIFFLLHSILSMHGKYCLHASCVAKNNRACLFLGKSGEGKTTISTILGKAGYEYMGDDLVFISQNKNGEIVVDALLCKAKLLNAKMQLKDSVDVIKNYNFKYSYSNKLGAILKLQRTQVSKKSMLLPATQAEAFAWLMNSGNNVKIQYQTHNWLNICEKAVTLPASTLMFADKNCFETDILDTIWE